MKFLSELCSSSIFYVIYALVAFCGILIGGKLSKMKKKKDK